MLANIRAAAVATTLAAALAGSAQADEMTMNSKLQAASLHDGPLDMVAYYVPVADGALEVTATFAPRKVTMMSAAPQRIVMALSDGDHVAFAMPGYPEARYDFARSGAEVAVSVAEVEVAPLWNVGRNVGPRAVLRAAALD